MTPTVEELWDDHFRSPAAAFARAQALVEAGQSPSPAATAWAELTIAFHHLFFTVRPGEARIWLERAATRFREVPDRRGELLALTGSARLMIAEQTLEPAREQLLSIYAEARELLPPRDRFWVANALGAVYYFSDRIDEAIRYLYEALEMLRTIPPSPQLPTIMSNLAAALLTVGDYEPARELAQDALGLLAHYDNPQMLLFARANLAEALRGIGQTAQALAVVDTMVEAEDARPRRAAQNHYCAIAAEVYALHGRYDDALRYARLAEAVFRDYPGGFNEVNCRWARAALLAAQGPDGDAIAALQEAAAAAERAQHLPTLCKTNERLAQRFAALGNYRDAFLYQQRFMVAQTKRLANRASVKYYLLKVEHELRHARDELDRAERQRQESVALNRQLERLNTELQHKVREVEILQAQLAVEAMHDPLTQLFNRRYLDAVMPGLLASAERREAPLAVALVDLDHFKRVNDRFGHPAGDTVLMHIGRLFSTALRSSDVFCRYGGEEFCVAFPDTDAASAQCVLASLAARLADLVIDWDGQKLQGFAFSAGVAAYPAHGDNLTDLVACADRALYAAKGAGRDRIIVASPVLCPKEGELREEPPAA